MVNTVQKHLSEVAQRIQELRIVLGMSVEEAARKTGLRPEEYIYYEQGNQDLPFSFIHNCALAFDVDMGELLEGRAPMLRHYQVTRGGEGSFLLVHCFSDGYFLRFYQNVRIIQ